VSELLLKEMEEGLGKATNAQAIVKMFPTYVRGLPDGSERGNYLALDLGGTNFRVLLITLKGAQVDMKNKIYPISEELMQGHGTKLFDHIAQCIADFMKAHSLHSQHLPLGFTFSFPCKQEGLARGKLVQWTKGFKCEGVEGEDVVQLLHEAIKRRNDINVECVALLNDTVGCLMSCAFLDHNCEIGVILGTGTNACYLEHLDRVQTWDGDRGDPRHVIINTEWGAFGSNGVLDFLRTDADRQIDAESLNPGRQIYEKMISGMYMGELVRLIVVDLLKKKLMFNGTSSPELETIGRFYTKFVSEIEADSEDMRYPQTKQILEELGVSQVSDEDCANLKYICGLVSRRAAFLASAGIATLLNRINKPNITVAVDGSLYRFHPHFHDLMMQKIAQLLSPGLKFQLMLSEDGSGKGAALVAAVSNRLLREKQEKEGKQ
jgi:hexokinase